jgi:hypothetical protein
MGLWNRGRLCCRLARSGSDLFFFGYLAASDEHCQQRSDIPDGILNSKYAKHRQYRTSA